MKRQRGRGRKPGGNPGNRPHESNGPDVKIRGTAAQIHEKYMQYARDAQTSGDRVRYENLLQHAEHYFRIMAATMPKDRMPGQQHDGSRDHGHENGSDSLGRSDHDTSTEADMESDDNGSTETDAEVTEASGEEPEADRAKSSRRRRPRRRNSEGEGSDGEHDTEAKSALDKLAHKQAAVAGG